MSQSIFLAAIQKITAGGLPLEELLVTANTLSVDEARQLYQVTTETLDWISSVAKEHGFPLRFRRNGCLEILTDAQRAEEAHQKAELLASWGLPIQFLRGAALEERLRAKGAVGATFDPTTGQLHGLDLLYGLRAPSEGRVLVDHVDLRSIHPESWREHVALVRELEVFEGTVAENVRMNRPDVTAEDVRSALASVGVLDVTCTLYPGARHEIFNETNRDEVTADLVAWLDSHLP